MTEPLKKATDHKGWSGWCGSGTIYNRPNDMSDQDLSNTLRSMALEWGKNRSYGYETFAVVNSKGSIEGWAISCGTNSRGERKHSIGPFYIACSEEMEAMKTFTAKTQTEYINW
jgi:hypothetical protein